MTFLQFKIVIEGNYGAPQFTNAVKAVSVIVGQSVTMVFPSVTDPDSDRYHFDPIIQIFTTFTIYLKIYFFDANRGLLSGSSSLLTSGIKFTPRSDALAGFYTVNITIIDENKYPFSAIFQGNITVIEAPKKGPKQMVSPVIIQQMRKENKLKIIDVTIKKATLDNRGILRVQLYPTSGIPPDIQTAFNNLTFQLFIQSAYQTNGRYLNFIRYQSIAEIAFENDGNSSLTASAIQFQVTGISPLSAWRQIQAEKVLIIQTNATLLSMVGEGIAYVVAKGIQIEVKVDRYVDPSMQAIAEAIQSSTQGATMGMLGCSIAINWLLAGVISMLWGLLNDLSSLTILSMIAIDVPGIAQTILGYILTFTQLDILPSDLIFGYIFAFNDEEDTAVSTYFETAGISSKNSLKNMGSTAIYVSLNLILLLFIAILNIVCPDRISNKFNRKLLWNHFFRSIIQQYLALFISSFIQISIFDLRFDPSGEASASVMAAFVLALTSFTPLIMFNIISQRRNGHITKREYFRKFNTITVGLKDLKLSQEAWHCISLCKWALTIIVLVQMREYPAQQIQILLVTSVAYQAYLIKVQPYDIALENKMCLYNESLVSIVLYFYIIATEYNKVIHSQNYWNVCSNPGLAQKGTSKMS